ncbi:MAG: pilus assembly protein [Betaproteobacteria bacterium]|nr:pilus assembly protein [Betaproteobacteria bacterium]
MKVKLKLKKEAGSVVVEFALVLPLLLLILFGTIEFGIMMYDQAIITNAAREGARWGAVQSVGLSHPISCSDPGISSIQGGSPASCSGTGSGTACLVASNYGSNALISFGQPVASNPSVTVSCGAGGTINVTVSYTYQGLGLGVLSALQGTEQLTSTSVMYYE